MELMHRFARAVRLLLLTPPERIEFNARCLVQKLAREEAAVRAARVARLNGEPGMTLDRLDRVVRNARIFRDVAERDLRRALELPEYPTRAEIADWGVAPVPPAVRGSELRR